MKRNLILSVFFLAAISFSAFKIYSPVANNPVDKTNFSDNFKLVFEAAKKRFVSEIGIQDKSFTDVTYKKKFATTISFKDATVAIVEDDQELKIFRIMYSFNAATLDEAKAVKKEIADWVKTLVPSDYKTYSTYVAGYAGYMTEMFEYNSDVFAEVSKKPVVRVGIILIEDGKYNLEIIVSEPVFKEYKR